MRVVEDPDQFLFAFQSAQREAENAFGDGRVYLEKYLEGPKHIEFQILADSHGSVVHLYERDCSIQRRHQKVIEEAPSSVLSDSLREQMGSAAVAAAKSCSYVGVGTVEFLLDSDQSFYFLEMNTRLQVEHPITEMITGLDLVAEQIRIARGEKLGFDQSQISSSGHAIECRVYAEDVLSGFLPDPGLLREHTPPEGPGVRVDSGVGRGLRVSVFYDPMISKVVAWGLTRDIAIRRMERALTEYEIVGVSTTIPFCRHVMTDPVFKSGSQTTSYIDTHFNASAIAPSFNIIRAVAVTTALSSNQREGAQADLAPQNTSSWRRRRNW